MGHFGSDYMVNSVHATGKSWPGIHDQASQIVKQCTPCQQYNASREGYHPARTSDASFPLDHVAVDCAVLNCTSDGDVYILILIDYFTKFVWIRTLPDKKMTTIARSLWDIFSNFGLPKIIQSDNGSEFVNKLIKALVAATHMDHRLTTPYYPQANGRVERTVRTALNSIKKQLMGCNTSWAQYVPLTQLAINLQVSTKTQASPFTLMFGRPFAGLSDFRRAKVEDLSPEKRLQYLEFVHNIIYPVVHSKHISLATQRQEMLDRNRKLIHTPIPPGTEVLLKNEYKKNKLDPLFVGPLTVVRCNKGEAYTLRSMDGSILPRDTPPSKLKVLSDLYNGADNEHYEVDAILNHRIVKGSYQYLVRWRGYDPSYDTWQPADTFDDLTIIQEYWKRSAHD
jgi:hypothetical protein